MLPLPGFQESNSRFCQPSLPSLPQESRLQWAPVCASTAVNQGEDRPSPAGAVVPGWLVKEKPGGQRQAEATARPGTKDGHCWALVPENNWFWTGRMTHVPKLHSGNHESRAALGPEPSGKQEQMQRPQRALLTGLLSL